MNCMFLGNKKWVIKIDIRIDKNILNKVLNDDIETELRQTIHNELSKSQAEINYSKIKDCMNAIILLKNKDSTKWTLYFSI